MRPYVRFALALSLAVGAVAQPPSAPPPVDEFKGRPRALILSDIGNEPDDQMSLVRLLVYSNEIDIEALIATTSTWQKNAVHPETMRMLSRAYGQVRGNLLLHAQGWPTADALDAKVYAGQPAYGMAATGPGRSSPGSQAVISAATRDDPRPLWICLWGGANTLAQALIDARSTLMPDAFAQALKKLRVYSISDQDDAGPWIRREFPSLTYIVQPSSADSGDYYYATWTGISGDVYYRNGAGADTTTVTNEWLDSNIRAKGPLGKVYPKFMFIMEGDTPSFLGLIDNGLNAYRPRTGAVGAAATSYARPEAKPTRSGHRAEIFSPASLHKTRYGAGKIVNTSQIRRRSGVGAKPFKTTSQPGWIGPFETLRTPTITRESRSMAPTPRKRSCSIHGPER